jgi:hypothetical protein
VLREPRFFGKKAFEEDVIEKRRRAGDVEAVGPHRYRYTCPSCHYRENYLGLELLKQKADYEAGLEAAKQRFRQQPGSGRPARGGQFGGGINIG